MERMTLAQARAGAIKMQTDREIENGTWQRRKIANPARLMAALAGERGER